MSITVVGRPSESMGGRTCLFDYPVEPDRDVASRLSCWPRRLVAVVGDGEHRSGCLVVSLLTENAAREPVPSAHTDAYIAILRRELTQSLQRAADHGLVAADTVSERTELLVTAVLGINAAARGRLGNDAVDAMANAVRNQIRR